MDRDPNSIRETDIQDERMRDRNVTGADIPRNRTMTRSRTEKGEIAGNEMREEREIRPGEASRSDLGAGE